MLLPNTLIVGAPRCGTTFLYNYLRRHPQVFMSDQKEPWHFASEPQTVWMGPGDGQPVTSRRDYAGLFQGADPSVHSIIGEASTIYLSAAEAPRRICTLLPEPKIICVLRDPVERAWSNYVQHVLLGREALGFEDALAAERRRAELGWSPFWQYATVSKYRVQLERWRSFVPAGNLMVLLFDDLVRCPEQVYSRVASFLDISPSDGVQLVPDRSERNESSVFVHPSLDRILLNMHSPIRRMAKTVVPPSVRQSMLSWIRSTGGRKASLPLAVKQRLLADFEEDVAYVEQLLHVDLSSWRR